MVEFDMDCSHTEQGWFEVKSFLTNGEKKYDFYQFGNKKKELIGFLGHRRVLTWSPPWDLTMGVDTSESQLLSPPLQLAPGRKKLDLG